ncbi:MAG: adenylate/guanylate cyclase domain-containing protein [Desulfobacca sp.]|uniref:adenylate/guanylate cyclase domain-containing protein n=1 Tax=Desulfobacca sp. TaxID=2067990 RepID=UPI00404B660C
MPSLEVLPEARQIEAEADETILQALLRHNILQAHICGGKGRCSTCRVLILTGLEYCTPRTRREQRLAERLHFPPEIRLACQTRLTGPVRLRRLIIDDEDLECTDLTILANQSVIVGTEKGIFILFADIEGFTAFAEALLPYDIVHILNRFFNRMGRVIRQYHGYINAYMGDGLMALFEAADPASGAASAVQAGLAMLRETTRLQPYLEELFHRSFQIRIGLHYGKVVTGAFGPADSRRETVIGDAVNVASRIEAANKLAGTRFLISETVYQLIQEKIQVGKRLAVNLPGKSLVSTLYEVLAWSHELSIEATAGGFCDEMRTND